MIAAFFYSLNKIESIQDLEQVDQDNKIELVKLKEKAANETNQIIQSLEEGIIVIQNNTVLFKNRIFDKI
jgi:HD superfamily phosphohydrolase YqeK